MTLKTKKILNYSFLIIVIGFILGTLITNSFKVSEIPTAKIISFCGLLVVSILNVSNVRKQGKPKDKKTR